LKWWQVPLIVLIVVAAVPVILVAGAVQLLFSAALHISIWILWCARGRDVLFVSSDSPVWGPYVSDKLLARLGERAVILNWSERKKWRFSLARIAFYHFGGQSEFNPMAVVFRPFRRARVFRFWGPFRDWKHGDSRALHQVEREFLETVRSRRPSG
jgi:hypothetical protein